MTPEEFEKLDPAAQQAAVEHHNENVRQYWVYCRVCGKKHFGTLAELRRLGCGDETR